MRATLIPSIISRLAGAGAALWLCGAGAAWAGDMDLGSIQALLSDPSVGLCKVFNMSPCPRLPSVTQAVLQVAALGNNLPEMIRAQNNIAPGISVTASNPAAVPPTAGGSNLPMPFPLNSTSNPPLFVAGTTTTPPSGLLSTLTPLASISQSSGTAQPTQLYDSTADTFLYAVGVSVGGLGFVGASGLTDPDMVYFFYDDTSRTNLNFTNGQIVAKFSFPLTVLNNDFSERAVPTTLQFTATAAGDCSASNVVGDFKGGGKSQTLLANTIGINCAVVLSKSPTLPTTNHAIFEVAVPALITGACILPHSECPNGQTPPGPNTDPAYFWTLHNLEANPINAGVFTAFLFDDPGNAPSKSSTLGNLSSSIGLAPSAPPFCTTITCPPGSNPPPPPPGSITFALCASLPSNNLTLTLRPAVGAYYAMATSGETLLSAPLPAAFISGGTAPVCPSL